MFCSRMNKYLQVRVLVAFIVCFQTIGLAQNPLTKKIDVNVTNKSVEYILTTISTSAHIYFSYNPDMLPLDSVVSMHVTQKEIQHILTDLFTNRYVYKTAGQYIIIQKQKTSQQVTAAKQQKPVQVKGTIQEAGSGAGISNTSVYSINGKQQVLTDAHGNFELNVSPNDDIAIAVNNQNYVDTLVVINSATDSTFTISLSSKPIQDTSLMTYVHAISNQTVEQIKIVSKLLSKEILAHTANIDFFTERPFQISLVPYVGTNHTLSGTITNNLSLNVIAGYSYGLIGCELGGIVNINREQVKGVQISGFGNITGGFTQGVQISGFFNHNIGYIKGVHIAGFLNYSKDSVQGIEIAGFSNVVKHHVTGSQISGFLNTSKSFSGIQLAGFANISTGTVNGIQTSGFANICGDSLQGGQIAGFCNITKNNIHGIQLSGFINTAKHVDGIQISLINKADSVSGISIGFLNFIKKGYHSVSVKANETGGISLLTQFGTHKLYTNIGLTTYYPANTYMAGLEYGIGTLFFYNKRVRVHIDANVTNIAQDVRNQVNHLQLYTLSSDASIGIGNHFRICAGPSYKALAYNESEIDITNMPRNSIISNTKTYTLASTKYDTWIGAQIGLQYTW